MYLSLQCKLFETIFSCRTHWRWHFAFTSSMVLDQMAWINYVLSLLYKQKVTNSQYNRYTYIYVRSVHYYIAIYSFWKQLWRYSSNWLKHQTNIYIYIYHRYISVLVIYYKSKYFQINVASFEWWRVMLGCCNQSWVFVLFPNLAAVLASLGAAVVAIMPQYPAKGSSAIALSHTHICWETCAAQNCARVHPSPFWVHPSRLSACIVYMD